MLVVPLHVSVKGRARFKVRGLYRNESFGGHLEQTLTGESGIVSVQASHLTGNILILYNLPQPPSAVAALILQYAEAFLAAQPRKEKKAGTPSSRRQGNLPVPSKKHKNPGPAATSKRKFRKMVVRAEKQPDITWHSQKESEILDYFATGRLEGLTAVDADRRRGKYGPNVLPESVPRSGFSILAEQVKTVPVALLAAAAAISVATGGIADAVAIMTVVGINAVIGYVTESQSERIIHSLKSLVNPKAHVIRDGKVREIEAREMVPGDLFLLRPGNYVAADARLLEVNRMSIDESALTGESLPVVKKVTSFSEANIPLSERSNMCYMGTLVTGGQGLAVVVATGRYTEMGRIQSMVGETKPPATPMDKQLDQLGTRLVVISSALCGVVFLLGLVRGYGLVQMLKTAISLAVAAVPEGLPAVATTTLALGIREMRRHGVLIRHLNAIEALGATQVICLDKTGTITENRMTIQEIYAGASRIDLRTENFHEELCKDGADFRHEISGLVVAAVLCNESEAVRTESGFVVNGSATENALLHLAIGCGLDPVFLKDAFPRQKVFHRSEQRNYMVTLHRMGTGQRLVAVKGSPAEVLALCSDQLINGVPNALSEEGRLSLQTENEKMAGEALRVLGVAYAVLDSEGDPFDERGEILPGLSWLGLVGMADPIRQGVKDLIAEFHRAGIKTVMITGDQTPTAFTVGKSLALNGENKIRILESTSLSSMDAETMTALCQQTNVFSRVSPANKLQIVQAIQAAGRVVAMTGDGINDGPALKAADIGIAMGQTGTDVAREIADVVLEDDRLETMIIAVEEGRTIYANVRKALHFLLSTNLSEIMVTFTANAAGMGQPLTEMQLLWINMISDIFPGLALSLEQPEKDIMARPPRDVSEPIVTGDDMRRIAVEGGVISIGSLGCYGYGIARYGIGPRASSLAFLSLTLGQLAHALSCRSAQHTIFEKNGLPPNRYLNLALGGSLALQGVAFAIPGLRSLLGLGAIGLTDMLVVGGGALAPLLVNEAIKQGRKGENR